MGLMPNINFNFWFFKQTLYTGKVLKTFLVGYKVSLSHKYKFVIIRIFTIT